MLPEKKKKWSRRVVQRSDTPIDTARASHAAALYNSIYDTLYEFGWINEREEPTQFWPDGMPLCVWRHPDFPGNYDMTSAYLTCIRKQMRFRDEGSR